MVRKLCIGFGLAVLLASSAPTAIAQTSVKVGATVEATYQKGSREVREVQQWLIDHAEFRGSTMVGDPSLVTNVTVKYSASSTAGRVSALGVGDGPPVPLPSSGNNGDTIAISSCGGGLQQTWSYVWVGSAAGGGWVLMSYNYVKTRSCSGSGA